MIEPVVLAPARLRRLALAAQGLAKPAAFGTGSRGTQRAIEHLGYVQLDTISVVERAHHHTLWTRVPDYTPTLLQRLIEQRRVFEYWFHAAAYLPMRDYRFALPRMLAIRNGARHWFANRDRAMEKTILDRIRSDGPLRTRDFETAKRGPGQPEAGWWNWKPEKLALEALFMEGTLMSTARDGFAKVYELPERVLPRDIDTRPPSTAEYAQYLVTTALRSHAFAVEKEFSYLRRGSAIRQAVRAHLNAAVATGDLLRAQVSTPGAPGKGAARNALFYIPAAALDARPRIAARVTLLSPFDNCLIQRERTERIHHWDYQIECYVPAAKRRFGYFCLPILFGEHFVGRADCKADRKTSTLRILHLHIENLPNQATKERHETPSTEARDIDAFCVALGPAVKAFATFNGCTEIRLERVSPTKLTAPIGRALR